MKYIRTKDGELYLNLGETQNGIIVKYNYLGDGLDLAINYDAIEKQADTIEELCDEFVVVYKESKKFTKPFTSAYCDISDVVKEHDINECEIYGAIWTDRGLIYVTEMNEKGELELL